MAGIENYRGAREFKVSRDGTAQIRGCMYYPGETYAGGMIKVMFSGQDVFQCMPGGRLRLLEVVREA